MSEKTSVTSLLQRCFATIIPRWTIFIIDMLLVLLACILTFFIAETSDATQFLFSPHSCLQTLVVLLVYGLMSRLCKTFFGIIRYTGLEDAHRLFFMSVYSSIVLTVIAIVCSLFRFRLFSFFNIIEVGIISFSFILLTRLAIKNLYRRYVSVSSSKKKVIVLGSAINSIVLSNALKNEVDGRFYPVALLSLKGSKKGNIVNGIPIIPFNPDRIKEIFEHYDSKTLIFLATHMDLMKKGFADRFLEVGIELLLLNQVEEFEDSKNTKNVSSFVYNIKIEDLLGREPIHTDNPNISKMLAGKVVLVTGAAGSIGSEIVRQAALFKARSIVLFDQAETPMHNMQLELQNTFPETDIRLFIGDICNKSRLRQAFETYHPDYVFHAAAYKHVPMMECNPTEAILTNVGGSRNVADLALEYDVCKFVMISTDKAVNPTNVMGCSKRIAEIYVQSLFFEACKKQGKHTSFITTRFGNVLGSNGSVVPLFKDQIAHGGPVTVTHRDIIRYFMTIPEACNLVLEAGCMGEGGEIFVFDMGEPVKIYDLAKRMILLSGLKLDEDIRIVETGLRPGEKLYEELLNDKEKTTATYHKKIMVAQVRRYQYDTVVSQIEPIIELARKGDTMAMVKAMKLLVPEFKSRNSVFEQIDKLIEQEQKSDLTSISV